MNLLVTGTALNEHLCTQAFDIINIRIQPKYGHAPTILLKPRDGVR